VAATTTGTRRPEPRPAEDHGARQLRLGRHVHGRTDPSSRDPHRVSRGGFELALTRRRRHSTDATDPAWGTAYSTTNDHDLYAAAALRWLGTFLHDEIRVSPLVAIGVRHLLTDAETDAWQSIPGPAPVIVRSEQNRTAIPG
jgi:hypothetical protein